MNKSIYVEDQNLVSVHWESSNDFLEYLDTTATRYHWSFCSEYGFGPGNFNHMDVIRKSVVGDPAMLTNLQSKVQEIEKHVGSISGDYMQIVKLNKRKPRRGKMGDELDIHKVYVGQLDTAWRYTQREKIESHVNLATVVIDVSYNANVNCHDTLWSAAASVKIIDDLIKSGRSVKVIVQWTTSRMFTDTHKAMTNSIVIKEYGQNLSLEALASMSHVGFMRSWGFLSAESQRKHYCTQHLGHSIRNAGHIPVNFKEEVAAGNTKFIFVGQTLGLSAAIGAVKDVKQTLEATK